MNPNSVVFVDHESFPTASGNDDDMNSWSSISTVHLCGRIYYDEITFSLRYQCSFCMDIFSFIDGYGQHMLEHFHKGKNDVNVVFEPQELMIEEQVFSNEQQTHTTDNSSIGTALNDNSPETFDGESFYDEQDSFSDDEPELLHELAPGDDNFVQNYYHDVDVQSHEYLPADAIPFNTANNTESNAVVVAAPEAELVNNDLEICDAEVEHYFKNQTKCLNLGVDDALLGLPKPIPAVGCTDNLRKRKGFPERARALSNEPSDYHWMEFGTEIEVRQNVNEDESKCNELQHAGGVLEASCGEDNPQSTTSVSVANAVGTKKRRVTLIKVINVRNRVADLYRTILNENEPKTFLEQTAVADDEHIIEDPVDITKIKEQNEPKIILEQTAVADEEHTIEGSVDITKMKDQNGAKTFLEQTTVADEEHITEGSVDITKMNDQNGDFNNAENSCESEYRNETGVGDDVSQTSPMSPTLPKTIIGETVITHFPEGYSASDNESEQQCNPKTLKSETADTEKSAEKKGCVCPACGRIFRNSFSLSIHKRAHYLESKNNIKLAYKCNECDMMVNKLSELQEHMVTVHFPDGFICRICSKELSSINLLEKHIRKIHLNRPYTCSTCKKNFVHLSQFESHKNTPNGGCHNNHRCHICGRKYNDATSLEHHIKNHKEQKQRACGICGKMTLRLTQHMKVHLRPIVCHKCNLHFQNTAALGLHKRTEDCNTIQTEHSVCGSANVFMQSYYEEPMIDVGNENTEIHIIPPEGSIDTFRYPDDGSPPAEVEYTNQFTGTYGANFFDDDYPVPPIARVETIAAVSNIPYDNDNDLNL